MNGCEQTALHLVAKNCQKDPVRFHSCISLLVDHNVEVNSLDWLGNAALHYAAENSDQETVLLLLKCGAYLGVRNYEGQLPLSGIEPGTLKTFLDSCITLVSKGTLKMKYEFLVPDNQLGSFLPRQEMVSMLNCPIPEMDPVLAIADSSKLHHLLSHPVLSAFINIKWNRVRTLYFCSVLFYCFFVSVLTSVLLEQFLPGAGGFWRVAGRILLAVYCLCELLKFVFMLTTSPARYVHDHRSLHHLVLLVSAVVVVCGSMSRPLAAATFLYSWLFLFSLVGQHHCMAVHFDLYRRVCYSFLKIFVWSSLMLLGFSLSFHVLLMETDRCPISSLFSTSSMPFESLPVVSHLLFILFCFLVLVVLLNMLVSVAVQHGLTVLEQNERLSLLAMARTASNIERRVLGNPLYVHLWLKQLRLNSTRAALWTENCMTRLWTLSHWRRYMTCLQNKVVLYPSRSVVFQDMKDSSFAVRDEILREAADIARGKVVHKDRLSEIQAVQQEILALLKTQKSADL